MGLIQLNLSNPPVPAGKRAGSPVISVPYNLATLTGIFQGTRTLSGQFVNAQTALRASAVLACIRILTEDLSALPLNLFRRTATGNVLATDDPRYRLLHDAPNPWMTSMEMRESLILDALCFGQSFAEKVIAPDGISELHPLSAGRMVPMNPIDLYVPPPVPLFWRYADPRTGQRVLMSDDLWCVKLLAPAGYLEGQSLILLAREAIGLLLAAEEQGARLFSHGVQSDIVFTAPEELEQNAHDSLTAAINTRYAGSQNAWRPILLQGGMDVKRISLTAQESQYIEARAFQLQDIARVFRIPDVLLGISHGRTATFASAEQFFLSYTKHTLQPWCTRIEQAANRDLLAPSETDLFFKHDLDALMRADLQTRYAAHASGIAAGFLTRNEARQMENLPTLPGLDEPLSPLNMGSGSGGKIPPAQGAGARFAQQLAKNAVSHEAKLLADGKSPADVYGKLLPGYLASKTGLTAPQCAEYCRRRLEQPEADAVELLAQILIGAGPQ